MWRLFLFTMYLAWPAALREIESRVTSYRASFHGWAGGSRIAALADRHDEQGGKVSEPTCHALHETQPELFVDELEIIRHDVKPNDGGGASSVEEVLLSHRNR